MRGDRPFRVPLGAVILLALLLPLAVLLVSPHAYRYVIGQDVAASVVVAAVLLVVVATWAVKGSMELRYGTVLVPLGVFLMLTALSITQCRFAIGYGLEDAYRYFLLAAMFLLVLNWARDGTRLLMVASAWALSAVPLAILEYLVSRTTILTILRNWYEIWGGERVGTVLGNVNIVGGYMAGVTVLVVPATVYFVRSRRWLPAAVSGLVFLIGAAGVWLSYSFGARLGLVAGVCYLVVALLPWSIRKRILIGFCALFIAATSFLLIPPLRRPLAERLRGGRFGDRIYMYEGAMRLTAARPLLGFGPGSFVIEYPFVRDPESFGHYYSAPVAWHAHNHFLETAAENGVPAAAALCVFYIFCLLPGLLRGRTAQGEEWNLNRIARLGAAGACSAFLAHGAASMMLDGPLVPAAYLWIGLALAFDGGLARRTFPFGRPVSAAVCAMATVLAVGTTLPIRALRSEVHAKNARTAQLASAWETAVYHHDKCLAIRPYALTRINSKAISLQNLGRHDKALQALRNLRTYAPLYGDALYLEARSLRAAGRQTEATRLLRRWIRINPYDPGACAMLIDFKIEAGEDVEALALADTAVKTWPDDPRILAAAGRAYTITGRHQKAIPLLERAAQMDKENHWIQLNLAIALLNGKRTREARDMIEDIVRRSTLDPTDYTLRRAYLKTHPGAGDNLQSLLESGLRKGQAGDFEEAREDLRLAALIRPEDPATLKNLAITYYQHARSLDRAERERRNALFREAASYFRAAHRQDPDNVSILEGLGYSLFDAQDHAASLEAWSWILDLDPSHPNAARNVKRLRSMLASERS